MECLATTTTTTTINTTITTTTQSAHSLENLHIHSLSWSAASQHDCCCWWTMGVHRVTPVVMLPQWAAYWLLFVLSGQQLCLCVFGQPRSSSYLWMTKPSHCWWYQHLIMFFLMLLTATKWHTVELVTLTTQLLKKSTLSFPLPSHLGNVNCINTAVFASADVGNCL